jgi:hypothetical protein
MVWSVERLREQGVALVKLEGAVTEENLHQMGVEVFSNAKQWNIHKLLVDDRHVKPVLPTSTIFKLPALFGSLGLQRSTPVAIVHSEEAERHEDWRFFETVAYNSGFNIKLFSEMDEALQWLALGGQAASTAPVGPHSGPGATPGKV